MDYTPPPNIPKPVIKYVKKHTAPEERKILYHVIDKDNVSIYVLRFYGKPGTGKVFVHAPATIIYDNKTVRWATREEHSKLWIYCTPKYFPTSKEQIYSFGSKD